MACNTILYVGNSCKVFSARRRQGLLPAAAGQGSPQAPFFVDAPPSGVASRLEPLGYRPGGMGRNVQEV